MISMSNRVSGILVLLLLAVLTPLHAQTPGNGAGDTTGLENVSSEDLLKLKEDLEKQKSKLETERVDLLDKGLKQSKEFLEKSGGGTATTSLVLLQRAEYLFLILEDNFQAQAESLAVINDQRLRQWDLQRDEYKARLVAEGKDEKAVEEALGQIPPPNLIPDPERDYSEILRTYQQLVERFPESPYVVDAMYNIAYIKESQGKQLKLRELNSPADGRWAEEGERRLREALKVYQDLAVRFSDSKYAAEAYNRIGEYYFSRGGDADLQKAIKNYSKVLDYPQSPRFPEAVYKLAWTHYRLGNYPQAISYFTYLVDDVDSARHYNVSYQELDTEAIIYIGISFNRWAEQIDLAQGTSDGGHKLIRSYIDEAKLNTKRYAPDIMWALAESYDVEQKDTLALRSYRELLDTYPLYAKGPDAQYKVISTFQRLSNAAQNATLSKSLTDSVLSNRFKLYEMFKPGSEWSVAVEDKETVRRGNQMARDVLVENIFYYYEEAAASPGKENWRIALDFSKQFISYFPTDTFAYKIHYNVAFIQHYMFGQLDSAFEEYINVANKYTYDTYRYKSSIDAYLIADSLNRRNPYKKPANAPGDSILPLTPGEEKLIEAINNYSRLFSDTVTQFPMDSLTNPEPVLGIPGRKTADFLAYAGEIYFNHNDFNRSSQYFNTVLTRYPNSDKVIISEKYLMKSYLDRKDYRSSEIVARRILNNPASSGEQKDEAVRTIFYTTFKHAEVFQQKKESARAGREFERAYVEGTQLGYKKREELGVALFNSGIEYTNSRELKRAIRAYEIYADTFPDTKDAPNALFNTQSLYAEMKDMKAAARTSERLADKYPSYSENDGAINAEIVLYNAEYYLEQAAKQATSRGDTMDAKAQNREAIRVSEKFVQRYPKSKYATEMDFGVAKLLFAVNEEEKAFQKYREFANRYPTDKRNVQALYEVGINHLKRGRRGEAILAFQDTKKKSDELKKLRLDYNKYFSSEAVYELARLKYEDFSKISLKNPGAEYKETMKFTLVKELIELYQTVTEYAHMRTYEAAYYRGLVREEFGEALANRQFKQEKDVAKQIIAQSEVYAGAAKAYRGAVEEYINSYNFLDKAYQKFVEEEKAMADSVARLYPNKPDSARIVTRWAVEGRTAKDKEFSLKRFKDMSVYYRDLSRSKISRILYAVASAKKLTLDAYLGAPTTFKYGTLEYVAEKMQGIPVIKRAADEAIASFESAAREADSLGINDKYSSESRRNVVKLSGIVPTELSKLSFAVMDLYRKESDYYRVVVAGGEEFVDKTTRKGFYDVFYDIPIQMNVYMSQYAQPIGTQTIKSFSEAITKAKEKNLLDEDAQQIEKEMLNFAYEFAKMNYQEADTSDKYYKSYEATFFANQDKPEFAYYSEASATYNQVLTFARENARGVLEEAYSNALDLGYIKLAPDPEGKEGDQIAITENVNARRILALLGKYDQYYAKLLKLKSYTKTYASNYSDWKSYYRYVDSWQTPGFDDGAWYAAAAPPASAIVAHAVLDTNEAYPIWIGLGQGFSVPKLPDYVPEIPKEIVVDTASSIVMPIDTSGSGLTPTDSTVVPDDSGASGSGTDTTKVEGGETDTMKLEDVESYFGRLELTRRLAVVQDSAVRPVYSQIEMQKILDTSKTGHFRMKFDVVGSPQGGRISVAADGYYEFYLNGAYIGAALAEQEDTRGDSLEITDLFPENFVQGLNVLAIVLKDQESPQQHHGLRVFLEVNEVEDASAAFAEPPLPKGDGLRDILYRRGRVIGK